MNHVLNSQNIDELKAARHICGLAIGHVPMGALATVQSNTTRFSLISSSGMQTRPTSTPSADDLQRARWL